MTCTTGINDPKKFIQLAEQLTTGHLIVGGLDENNEWKALYPQTLWITAALRALANGCVPPSEPAGWRPNETENERADAMNTGLNRDAFRAAWKAFQNTPIDLTTDSDDETCKCLCTAIRAFVRTARPDIQAACENIREAWSALAMIRETVETLGPIGAMKASEHLDGPTFMHEADAVVTGIRALATHRTLGLED